VNRPLACAFALASFAATAQAADLGDVTSMKDPLPDTLTFHGVTIYGTIDVGYAYQTNGKPLGPIISDLEYSPFTTTRNYTGTPISSLQANALEQSKIGVKIEEDIGLGLTAIGKLDTGFNPISGELTDGCSSFVQNAAKSYTVQTSNADTSRCGQAFNGVAYAGVSSPIYGTLTVGRQQSFQLDSIASYDPLALSYALSLLGYSGTNGGSGSTEAARWDNSVKYLVAYGPVHAGVMYSGGGEDTGIYGGGVSANVGAVWKGFSIDGVYSKENGVVNLLGANKDTVVGAPLAAAISNDEGWSVMGKYVYDFGGGFKDEGPAATLTLFAGYTSIAVSNSNAPVSFAEGGYAIGNGAGGSPDHNYFTTTKDLDFEWAGAKYALPSGWSFTGAFYHVDQGKFISDNAVCTNGGASRTDCAGSYNQGSFLIDYAFNKHFDVYAGVTYAVVDGGLAAGYSGTPCGVAGSGACASGERNGNATSIDTAAVVTGARLKF
jgi:predicted porin